MRSMRPHKLSHSSVTIIACILSAMHLILITWSEHMSLIKFKPCIDIKCKSNLTFFSSKIVASDIKWFLFCKSSKELLMFLRKANVWNEIYNHQCSMLIHLEITVTWLYIRKYILFVLSFSRPYIKSLKYTLFEIWYQ